MKIVGVKVLEARLSEFLRLVKGGETVLVTDRGAVVAELRPPRRAARPVGSLEETLEDLADAGEVTRARIDKAGWTWRPRGLGLPAGAARRLLGKLGAERI